jgi:hypothetical protein
LGFEKGRRREGSEINMKKIILIVTFLSLITGCAANQKKSTAIVPELEGKDMVPINKIESLNKIKQPKSEPSVLVN